MNGLRNYKISICVSRKAAVSTKSKILSVILSTSFRKATSVGNMSVANHIIVTNDETREGKNPNRICNSRVNRSFIYMKEIEKDRVKYKCDT